MDLIIINGLPGTGKTTIAKPLSSELGMPLIAKDAIKEFLFDQLGVKDREWSRTLGKASNDFLYELAGAMLANGESIMIENAFEASFAKPRIQHIIDEYHPTVLEIYCSTSRTIRRRRFIDRNESGSRHVGHIDNENYLTEADQEPYKKYAPLDVGILMHINTNTDIDIREIARSISLAGR